MLFQPVHQADHLPHPLQVADPTLLHQIQKTDAVSVTGQSVRFKNKNLSHSVWLYGS
ncbi:MAG: hypothetical protein HC768_01270 [Acaryochloris sp. CRU_2_0]|nr:hypothetical protein [Acaryochloris sp. CRU_2_0]